jgi:general secretion pathway protein D
MPVAAKTGKNKIVQPARFADSTEPEAPAPAPSATVPAQTVVPVAVPVPATDNPPAAMTDNQAATGGMSLSWAGANSSRVGNNFVLRLNANSSATLSSLPITVGFDSAVFSVVAVNEGDFLKQGGAQSNFTSQIDPGGQILISGSSIGGSGASSGTVASITFHTVAPSAGSMIQVLSAAPIDNEGHAIDAKVTANTTVRVDN